VIITKCEEVNIEGCLDSVYGWVDEIIVVDDESTDRTVKLARKYTDKVISRRMDIEGRHRNWAYAQAKNKWVLSLDADERLTEALKEEVNQILNKATEFVGFTIPRRNLIGSYWLRWGGQYPAAQLKLFRRDKFKWEEVQVHPRCFLDGPVGHLKNDIIHYSWRDFTHFFEKVNSQSTLEAKKWIYTGRKMSMPHAFWRTLDRFFRKFIRKKGYKDGFYGFIAALSDSLYQILSYAKYWEMKRKKMKIIFIDRDGVINEYPGDTKYVTSWQEFRFLPNTKFALKKLTEAGYKIFIISNQAGVTKGIYSKDKLDEITKNMLKELSDSRVEISGVYYCIHRDEDNCSCRKPKIGLLQSIINEHNISNDVLGKSFLVGDSQRDIQTGRNAGCRTILVFSGKEKLKNKNGWSTEPDFTAKDLLEAADLILETHS